MAVYGLPALRYLASTDEDERRLLVLVTRRADLLRTELEKSLATTIANAFVKARLYGN